jgi:hypothetical protein
MYCDFVGNAVIVLIYVAGFKGCEGGKDCLGTEGALRVSLGCFVSSHSYYNDHQ